MLKNKKKKIKVLVREEFIEKVIVEKDVLEKLILI